MEKIWWHSATTSERGFWLNTEKDLRHSGATTMRGLWLVSGKKLCDDILRLHLSEVFE